jgi:hypothetical protein
MASGGLRVDHHNDPMNVTSTITGVLIGLVVGFPGGMLYSAARRGWADLATAKKGIPVARKNAFVRTREAVILGVLLAIVGAVAIGIARGR